jgi:Xaa-Pro aminopeptidase
MMGRQAAGRSILRQEGVSMNKAAVVLVGKSCLMAATVVVAQPVVYPAEEFAARRAALCDSVGEGYVLMFGASNRQPGVRFRQDNDFYYLTGVEDLNAALVINVQRDCRATLFLPSQGKGEIKMDGANLLEDPERAAAAGFARVLELARLHEALASIQARQTTPLWLRLQEPDFVDQDRHETGGYLAREFATGFGRPSDNANRASLVGERFPSVTVRDITPHLDALRVIKTACEIEVLRRNGRIGAQAIQRSIEATEPGKYEYELAAEAAYVVRKQGCEGDGYAPIVASGPNLKAWHYERNDRKLEDGDLIVMDYGGSLGYLTIDITRTWPASGTFSGRELEVYRCVLEAQKAVIAAIRPGVTREDTRAICTEIFDKHGFGDHKPFGCGGHFVGMSVHDVGDETEPFAAGMVLAIEPIIAIDDEQIHVRIEDTVLVTDDGAEVLSSGLPKEVDEVLALVGRAVGAD